MARLAVLIASALFAASAWAADLTVSGAWIRHLPAGVPAGGFFTVHNLSKQDTALVGASSPDYGMVMIHKTIEEGGVSRMVEGGKIVLPAGGKVAFRPGGYHLMLMHAKHEIKVGTKIPVTLEFAGGQKVTALFEVRGATAR
ncbi:MAG: copper chaperone PCu(A)C [Betaproteobacteria bacterium]|nr:copper chaperone PCu(A)C [Betaproteobacteria bacterium]